MILFDRMNFHVSWGASDALRIPSWARTEHLDRIAPQAELWRYR